jgi:acetoin:2,6-dichlorophenolindophenol oxidoreductase subunit beta
MRETIMREISYAEAVRETIRQQILANDKVFLIGEDVGLYGGAFGVSVGLFAEFGEDKIMDTPISEQGIVGVAIGAALLGMRPVVEMMFSDFTMLPLEQIANQAGKMRYMFGGKAKVPLVIRTPGGGGIGIAAQHSQSIEGLFLGLPGIKIVIPSTPYDVKGLLSASIKDDNPVLFFEHKLLYPIKGQVPEELYEIPLGVADIKRKGNDLTVIATSFMVQKALKVAEKLDNEGISIEVIDPRTIKPLDIDLIASSVKKTGKAVLVEEACYTGGFTSFLASEIYKNCFDFLDAPIERVTGLDCPIPYEHNLENAVIPDEKKIEDGIKKVLGLNK